MKVFADLHVHYYSEYNLESFLENIFTRLSGLINQTEGALGLIALTETKDCNFYQKVRGGQLPLPLGYKLEVLEGSLVIEHQAVQLLVIPGRQVNTIERIELLSLGVDDKISSGSSLAETLAQIESAGGAAVLNWAPGKWLFKRGQIIKDWMNGTSQQYFICDTSLRPVGYLKPVLTRLAERLGWRVLYGSDPLPDVSEERNVFKYFTEFEFDFDLQNPQESFKKMLRGGSKALGQRSSFLELALRMFRYYR